MEAGKILAVQFEHQMMVYDLLSYALWGILVVYCGIQYLKHHLNEIIFFTLASD